MNGISMLTVSQLPELFGLTSTIELVTGNTVTTLTLDLRVLIGISLGICQTKPVQAEGDILADTLIKLSQVMQGMALAPMVLIMT